MTTRKRVTPIYVHKYSERPKYYLYVFYVLITFTVPLIGERERLVGAIFLHIAKYDDGVAVT